MQASQGEGNENIFGDDGTMSDGQMAGTEGAFDRSLEEFDAIMGQEQEQMSAQGVGTAADEAFGAAGQIGGPMGSGDQQPAGGQAGGDQGGQSANSMPVFEDPSIRDQNSPQVEGCTDDDKVARQLCEAATEEEDPFLRAALWDEYNEYKQIILRQ
jgi:hypothetical protein